MSGVTDPGLGATTIASIIATAGTLLGGLALAIERWRKHQTESEVRTARGQTDAATHRVGAEYVVWLKESHAQQRAELLDLRERWVQAREAQIKAETALDVMRAELARLTMRVNELTVQLDQLRAHKAAG